MALGGKEDRELNLLLEGQDRRVGRRGFLRTAAVLGAAGAAGYAGGTVAGLLRDDGRCRATAATSGC
jgi:nitrous oxide reductase